MAKGSKSIFICERSGFKYLRSEGVKEPGTGLFVHKSESDGMYNRVDHPQNFVKVRGERIGLSWVRGEVPLSIAPVSVPWHQPHVSAIE